MPEHIFRDMDVSKTPVSILTEMMLKQNTVPNFELTENGSGTHQNIFTYVVVCNGIRATGSGRCKKDAKHEAASAMLKKIAERCSFPQLPASPNDSPVRTPLPMKLPALPKSPFNVPFRNFVGELTVSKNINSKNYDFSNYNPKYCFNVYSNFLLIYHLIMHMIVVSRIFWLKTFLININIFIIAAGFLIELIKISYSISFYAEIRIYSESVDCLFIFKLYRYYLSIISYSND